MYSPPQYSAEMLRILKHCCPIPCASIWLKGSQSWNNADVYPVLLLLWIYSNLRTVLMYSLPHYIAEIMPIIKHWGCIPCFITLLGYSQSQNISDVYLVSIPRWAIPFLKTLLIFTCLITLLRSSQSWNNADVYPVLSYGWKLPNLETLLKVLCHFSLLSSPLVVLHYWAIPYPKFLLMYSLSFFLLRCCQSQKIADEYPASLPFWDVVNLTTLLFYNLSYLLAEMLANMKYCWYVPCLNSLPSFSESGNIAEAYFFILGSWVVPHLIIFLTYALSQ